VAQRSTASNRMGNAREEVRITVFLGATLRDDRTGSAFLAEMRFALPSVRTALDQEVRRAKQQKEAAKRRKKVPGSNFGEELNLALSLAPFPFHRRTCVKEREGWGRQATA